MVTKDETIRKKKGRNRIGPTTGILNTWPIGYLSAVCREPFSWSILSSKLNKFHKFSLSLIPYFCSSSIETDLSIKCQQTVIPF